ncbi:glucose dehydrogenase [FAD, quinone] [Tribolium castaneum]|uniref:Glucose dehydrogenase [FAD, quinone]-like Protein n=1 Tax=Tribolium castaneum TaxID=7070 RepID=D2A6H9_TRICA|nr:PREDICTED: glucose dehydrogenase [FAD, quinone] [Tribolium castaneum]EFA05513.1 Glucose dehydrogenase [FAD, quinone]-like Protein [Tribolium castaneum]|eukprot:XP_008191987.1 PREDICTED: glucose dehydrogenase [FAD, quinone] [Tribolium castaneum]
MLKPVPFFFSLFALTSPQSLLDGLINFIEEGDAQSFNEPPDTPVLLPSYDFIIVGAGTAGCVLANRLSENPSWNVLLLEAGRPENYLMDLPVLANYIQFTDANWRYKTEPSDKFCLGMENQQCNWPRGKVVGGSSVLNYMIYTRGNWRDYDKWAELGNEGWGFKDVLPYFKKIENFMVPGPYNASYHNHDGYLAVSYSPYKTKIADAVLESAQLMGLKLVDYNGPIQVGVSRFQVTLRDGIRESSSRAYLHPIKNRPNFHMRKYSTVTKILIDPTTKKVQGVEVDTKGTIYKIGASKEVLVAGGAVNSPQLLMLSGIGPKKHLTQMGIPVLSNLKVGYNLLDHVALGGLTFRIDEPYSLKTERVLSRESLFQFWNYHQGPITAPGGCEVVVFHDLKDPTNPDGYPDIELVFLGASLSLDPLLQKNLAISDYVYKTVYTPIERFDSFMVFPMILRPQSRGRIALRDNNYKSKPRIFPNYFHVKEDMETIIGGVRLTLNITAQQPMRKIGTRLHDIPIPQCAHLEFASDGYFECMARHLTFTIYHHCGTCKMGPRSDKSAVVDPRLRVYGVEGLRVIDASVMPEVPAAHTNAPIFMIAEKGADMIKEEWVGNIGAD